MFLVHSYIDLEVTEQLGVQPEGLITEEVLQAASHKAWSNCIWDRVHSSVLCYLYLLIFIDKKAMAYYT